MTISYNEVANSSHIRGKLQGGRGRKDKGGKGTTRQRVYLRDEGDQTTLTD